jgi:hypothetical protein
VKLSDKELKAREEAFNNEKIPIILTREELGFLMHRMEHTFCSIEWGRTNQSLPEESWVRRLWFKNAKNIYDKIGYEICMCLQCEKERRECTCGGRKMTYREFVDQEGEDRYHERIYGKIEGPHL